MKNKIHEELEKMFFEHYEEWCLLSCSYLKNKTESEEVVQDICVKLLLKNSDSKILNLRAYITTAIKNNSIQRIKKRKKIVELSKSGISFSSSSCEENLIFKENQAYLQNAVEALPELSKNIFNLCVLEGEKYKNVAKTLGISVNTVKYHIKKSYKMLRSNIQNTYYFIPYFFIFLDF